MNCLQNVFLVDSNSWQALQNSFRPLRHKCSLGKDWSLLCKPIFLQSVFFPRPLYLPWVEFWDRSLAIKALCGPLPGRTTWFSSSESWFDLDGWGSRLMDTPCWSRMAVVLVYTIPAWSQMGNQSTTLLQKFNRARRIRQKRPSN